MGDNEFAVLTESLATMSEDLAVLKAEARTAAKIVTGFILISFSAMAWFINYHVDVNRTDRADTFARVELLRKQDSAIGVKITALEIGYTVHGISKWEKHKLIHKHLNREIEIYTEKKNDGTGE